jgi:hypothetical protein
MRDQIRNCEATKYAKTGWCWSNSIIFFDQHHTGAITSPLLKRGVLASLPIHSHLPRPCAVIDRACSLPAPPVIAGFSPQVSCGIVYAVPR